MPKILAIDDKQDNLVTVSALLRNLIPGCTVITSDSGAEGIKKAESERPDTILLDIKMPEMDGYEVCRHLKSNEKTKHIPVVMLTAIKTDAGSRVKGLELGADAFLSKPIDEAELAAQVKVTLRIKTAEDLLRREKDLMEDTVRERTKALRESEEQYRFLIENQTDMIVKFNREGELLFVSPSYCKTFDKTQDELLGKKFMPLIHEKDRDAVAKALDKVSRPPYTGYVEERAMTKDGWRWQSWLNTAVLNEGNGIESIVAVGRDINDRKLAKEALRTRDYAIESSINGINFTDLQGNFVYANNSFLVMWGFKTQDDLIGRDNSDLWADQNRYHEAYNEFQKKGSYVGELKAKKRDGTEFDIQLSANTVKNENGEPLFLMTSFVDITQRNQAQEALRESEEKYRSMMEAMDDATYICSSDFRIEYMNPAMINRIGRDATGETCRNVMYGLDKECPWCIHDKIMRGEYVKYDLVSPADGKTYHISNSPIFHTDGSVSKLTVFRDLTETKKLEAQLQQAQKMEAIGTLAGGIAHDFNNLLMAIQGRASVMLMKKDSSHPDIRHLKGIENNVESAADLTKQLLGFARGGKYEVKPTDLNKLVKKQNRMFGRTKKQISIRGKYEKELWSVEVDQRQIDQVLLNLYVNAWQAMPAGGDLYLETENVALDENYVKPFSVETGRYVKISVTDTGVGMDRAIQKKIFDPFFSTKEMGRGTGLGLASAYGIIKNHGGFINVYSEKGHGSTFNIYLPASEKEIIEEKKPTGDTLRGTETVLFVDDEDMIIEVAGELFEQLGYKVLTAGSGKEAIKTYQENKDNIDIVLLDMIMPDMSGSDTYDKMKAIDPDIKVLLSSGYSINGQATEIMERGCSGFIQKPFKMKELSQKLREILDKR